MTDHNYYIQRIGGLEQSRREIDAVITATFKAWAEALCPIKRGDTMTIKHTTDYTFSGATAKVERVRPCWGTTGWVWRCSGRIIYRNGNVHRTLVDWDVPIEELREKL